MPSAARRLAARNNGGAPKAKLLTLDGLDRRTTAAQRALDLRDTILAERGGAEVMGALRSAMAASAAVLTAMVDDLEARWLRGEKVDFGELSALANTRRREAEAIGLDLTPRDITPDLQSYLRMKAAADA